VALLSSVFFAGGVGRALAYVFTGPPHPAFVVLMATEFVLPVIFIGLWAAVRGSDSSRLSMETGWSPGPLA
jgi:Domain of unknown function (DUF4345)